MELRRLRSFTVVAETLHFGHAAERFHIAQPALTQQIQHLEHEPGTRLLDRDRRSVRLTPVGALFLVEAHKVKRAALVAARARRGELDRSASWLGCFCPYVGAEVSMAGACSGGLRSRVLAAVEAGETPEAAARRFAEGRSTACRWVQAAHDEGRREAKPTRGGPAPRIQGAVEAAMLDLAGSPHRLSLAEIATRLAGTQGVRVHQRNPTGTCA